MSTNKHLGKLSLTFLILALLITGALYNGDKLGLKSQDKSMEYEKRLFDDSRVHTINIVMDDWDKFIASAKDKKYSACTIIIDGETYANVGIRAKGSSSLTDAADAGSTRYSFKVEFDHYEKAFNYHGLDKISLNNMIHDSTYMMDYLAYQMMGDFGVSSPLSSYTNILVNGEKWGLYLAVEGLEESFLKRNYGINYGNLYKPEGKEEEADGKEEELQPDDQEERFTPDVNLQYINDDPKSYSLFFDHAKTKISSKDKKRFISAIRELNLGNHFTKVLDTEKVIRYFVVHNFVVNGDSYTGEDAHNYYLYEKDGRLSMIPWDYNMSFGTFSHEDSTLAVNVPINEALKDRPMQSWIMKDSKYQKMYQDYYRKFLDSSDIAKRIQQTALLISPHVEKDPSKFCTYEEYQKAVNTLNRFCQLRTESIRGQLDGTIPSTISDQAANKAALIDASDIHINDMKNKKLMN